MTTLDLPFDDPEHFEEGLVHLADMLELADPRRKGAEMSRGVVAQAGVDVNAVKSLTEWKTFCKSVVKQLRSASGKARDDDQRAVLDATIDRIEQMARG
ncbi:MAG: hypothetical protein HY261_07710 [Chloroflexi bacterium]|nr:hypothetical protein [Chloroflexota bacterium]